MNFQIDEKQLLTKKITPELFRLCIKNNLQVNLCVNTEALLIIENIVTLSLFLEQECTKAIIG